MIKEIWENTTFHCINCNGTVERVIISESTWKWKCKDCKSEFGNGSFPNYMD